MSAGTIGKIPLLDTIDDPADLRKLSAIVATALGALGRGGDAEELARA